MPQKSRRKYKRRSDRLYIQSRTTRSAQKQESELPQQAQGLLLLCALYIAYRDRQAKGLLLNSKNFLDRLRRLIPEHLAATEAQNFLALKFSPDLTLILSKNQPKELEKFRPDAQAKATKLLRECLSVVEFPLQNPPVPTKADFPQIQIAKTFQLEFQL